MSINDLLEKIKPFYLLVLCGVIASIFFGLGRLSAIEENHVPIRIIQSPSNLTANAVSAILTQDIVEKRNVSSEEINKTTNGGAGQVIGSKNSKKYYFPWCGTLKLVKAENRVTFASIDLARKEGYLPAGNCKGLK